MGVRSGGLSQTEAIDAIYDVFANKGPGFGAYTVAQADGSVVMVGTALDLTAPVVGAPIAHVAQNGAVTLGTATVQIVNGAINVANVVLR